MYKLAYNHYSILFTKSITINRYQSTTCAQSTEAVRGFRLFEEMGNTYHRQNVY